MSDTPEPIEARAIVEKLALNELVGRAIADAFYAGFQAGYDAAITDSYGVEPDDPDDFDEPTDDDRRSDAFDIERERMREEFPRIDSTTPEQYMTLDETTQRMRPMTPDEITELRAKVLPPDERLPLDMSDDMPDNTRSESTIDSRQ